MPRPRKYAGPLRKGERSAKVAKRTPARFAYSKKTYRKNTTIAKTLSKFSERKLKALRPLDEAQPFAIQVGAQAFYYSWNTGVNAPAAWSGFQPVGGFDYTQGSDNNGRDGRYMFLDHTTANMSIHMNGVGVNYPPTQFRVICFKARRATTPAGISYAPTKTLFLKSGGDVTGHEVAGFNGNDISLLPLNKRDWIILKDSRFTLQNYNFQASSETASFQGKYPSFKQMRMNFNHKIKTSFENEQDEPLDFDFHYGVIIYAMSVGRDQKADAWEVNLRGTTSAFDN